MATIVTIATSDQISNSRADINTNFANLNSDKIETSVIDTDTTLAANSDAKVPSQKAAKAYMDAIGAQTFLVPTGAIFPYGGSSAPSNFLLCNGSAVSRSTYATLFGIVSTTYGVGDGSTTFNLPNLINRVPIGAGTGTVVATFASRASNVITVTGLSNAANNEYQTGQAVLYSAPGVAMTGLTHNTTYYIIRTGNLTFSLATTLANALAGTAIALSSDGTGTQTFTLTFTARTLGNSGGEENHSLVAAENGPHTHSATTYTTISTADGFRGADGGSTGTATTTSSGSGTAHNNFQPFIVLNYIIKT